MGIRPIVCDWDAGGHRPGTGANSLLWRDLLAAHAGLGEPIVLNRRLGEALPCALEACTHAVLDAGQTPLLLGGDHRLSYAVLQAVTRRFGPTEVHQFDAHHDAHPAPAITNYSVFRHAAQRLPVRMVRYGLREAAPRKPEPQPLAGAPAPEVVYLTVDLDYLDPGVFPAVNWPMPVPDQMRCGIDDLEAAVAAIAADGRLVAADIVEWCGQGAGDAERGLVGRVLAAVVAALGDASAAPGEAAAAPGAAAPGAGADAR